MVRACNAPAERSRAFTYVFNRKWRGRDLNPRPRAYESYDLIKDAHTPRCGLFGGFYAFLPRYGGL